jgi:hypothetical protein
MKKVNVLYVLVLLMILTFVRSIFFIYFNYTTNEATGVEGLGLVMNILIFGVVVYLLHGFKFNPLLTFLLYLMLVKPLIAAFSYLEKNYQLIELNPTMKSHLREIQYHASNFTLAISFLTTLYILHYVFFNK